MSIFEWVKRLFEPTKPQIEPNVKKPDFIYKPEIPDNMPYSIPEIKDDTHIVKTPVSRKCIICGQIETIQFRCHGCGQYVCGDHKIPEMHNCTASVHYVPKEGGIVKY
jgi:predicted nucleic acid binding AN1-type Zn finger protein